MTEKAKADFSGYATKAGLKCSDGRTIMPDAFKHQDQETVPLVWQHNHNEPSNVLGHAFLEHREDGVYAYAFLNDTDQAKNAKILVEHKDITSLSIYANQLVERSKQVLHGIIREVSLVLSGANPGALIDNITLAHADGDLVTLDDEAIIYTGLELAHVDGTAVVDSEVLNDDVPTEVETSTSTVQEIYNGMTSEQKEVVHFMVGAALENATQTPGSNSESESVSHTQSEEESIKNDEDKNDESSESSSELAHNDDKEEEGRHMTRNVFEQESEGKEKAPVLTHDAIAGIVDDAKKMGSLREAVEAYAFKHGIENIDVLFPDARTLTATPEFDKRRTEWVVNVMNSTRHSPFSRIKSIIANITFEEARAKGYIKGNLKKEEFFGVSKRTTTPSTIYKKQKLDRDDIIDITDFDVVAWLKGEMRLMLDEELARAILIGDGRAIDDDDKIKDPLGANDGAGIRSILHDHDLYAATITVDDTATSMEIVDAIVGGMGFYKGSGSPTLYTTLPQLTSMLVTRDSLDRRLWRTVSELASEMGVSEIVTVEVMEDEADLVGIIVNLSDYTIGADKGGDVNFFDDFDIDYNQYKYLLETRLSGALTRIRSAVIIKRAATGGTLATPVAPDFTDNVVTVATTTGVEYQDMSDHSVLTTAAPVTLLEGESLTVEAVPTTGYYFANNVDDQWTFTYEA